MVRSAASRPPLLRRWTVVLVALLGAALSHPVSADEGPGSAKPANALLSLPDAVALALRANPELAAIREQHGIAAAGIVIAETYPFNPTYEGRYRLTASPSNAGTINTLPHEDAILLEVEVRHQKSIRREAASAGLTRTDWEISFQEVGLVVRVMRAFDAVLYRREKLRLAEEAVQLNEESARQVAKLVDLAQLRSGDLIVARTEVEDTRAQLGPARASLTTAQSDLIRALGVVDCLGDLLGSLETALPPLDEADLCRTALEERADRHARAAAVAEADARLRLAEANRYGNPIMGPSYELDNTAVNYIGVQVALPLPVLNTHKGDILQLQAERRRAALDLQTTEVQIHQDVAAALQRLQAARAWVESYRTDALPSLRKALEQMQRLFEQNQPGTDVLRLIDIRRKLLRARDTYLDALWELSQARADLVAAVGDPRLVVGLPVDCPPETHP